MCVFECAVLADLVRTAYGVASVTNKGFVFVR